jgi:hypothetical protein
MAQAERAMTKPWLNISRTRCRAAADRPGLPPSCGRMRLSLLPRWITGLKSFSMLHREKLEILGLDEFVNLCLTTEILSNTLGVKQDLHSAGF